ncbi:MAG TPA: hypothetical protein VGM64_21535 [Lacunisphaera sp.]|jgi:uncharacterized membrane protein YgcG
MKVRAQTWFQSYSPIILLMAMLVLAGCVALPKTQISPELQYHAPTTGSDVASIKGSESVRLVLGLIPTWDSAFVAGIDGKTIIAGKDGWNTDVIMGSGLRTVTLAFQRLSISAVVEQQFNAMPGASYVVKFDPPYASFNYSPPGLYVDLWIADASTGKPVTSPVPKLAYIQNQGEYSSAEDVPVESVEFGGTTQTRPPVDRGRDHTGNDHGGKNPGGTDHGGKDHSGNNHRDANHGGPPSIPNGSRPSGSDSHGGSGGSHSSGGGSSSGSSGHSSGGGGGSESHSNGGSGKK